MNNLLRSRRRAKRKPQSQWDKPSVYFDVRPAQEERTGVGHFTAELHCALSETMDVVPVASSPFGSQILFHITQLCRLIQNPTSSYLSPQSLIVPALVGLRSSVMVHDITTLTYPELHQIRNRLMYRVLLPIALKRTGLVFVPSRAVANSIIARWPAVVCKVKIVPEAPRFPINFRLVLARPKTILFVGTIEPRKNVISLMKAFLTTQDWSDWTLRIVGRMGWLSEEDSKEFYTLASHQRISYAGYLSDTELKAEYGSSQIFCYVSEAEGFGLPPLEAMNAGLCTVISDDPALIEVAGDAALVVQRGPQLIQELAKVLDSLLANDDLRECWSDRGRERAQNFSWEQAAKVVRQALVPHATS